MQTAQIVAFKESIKFIENLGIKNVMNHEKDLMNYAVEVLRKNNSVKLMTPSYKNFPYKI